MIHGISTLKRQMPVILQSEAAECGLASICMIASYHGYELDLIRARQNFSLSLKGCTAADLAQIASSIGLQARTYALEVDELHRLQTPALLHWDMNHFVVLKRRCRRGYLIHDPSRGKRIISDAEFADHFTGIAMEFSRSPDFKARRQKERPRISQLLGSLAGLPRIVGELFTLSLLIQTLILLQPYLFQLVVDDVLARQSDRLLFPVCMGLAFLAAFTAISGAVRQWCMSVVSSRLSYQLTSNVMNHLIRLPLAYFEKRHTGDILMRLNSVQALQNALTTTIVAALIDGLVVTMALSAMLVYDITLGVMVLGFTSCVFAIRLICFPYQRRLQEAAISNQAKEQSFSIETLRSVQSLRIAGGEQFRMHRWSGAFSAVINSRLRLARFDICTHTAQQLIDGIQHGAVLYVAARGILAGDGHFSIGMLFAFLAFKSRFTSHAGGLVEHVISFKLLDLHLQRLSDILWQQEDVTSGSALSGAVPAGCIEAQSLSFSYSDFDAPVINDTSFQFKEGEMVAIIGPSGSGKTTLMKLLLGLYRPSSGSLHIGGIQLTRHNIPSWRSTVGAVLQEDQLVSGTIADNIAYHCERCDMSRVVDAAKAAGIHGEIEHQPMGYLALVGDLGSSLSAGQKQRLLIARALYRQPAVLLLDEGTANLDEENEERLANLITGLPMTRIVVAHRPALVRRADRVFRLSAGGLAEVSIEADEGEQQPETALQSL